MLSGLVRGSIRHRGVVLGLAAALVLIGVATLARAPLDVFPEFAPPQVSIQTEAPGLSPEQVELLVTKPLEDAINGVQGIAVVRSQSIQGLSVVTAVLAEGVDIYRARQSLAERLTEATGALPAPSSIGCCVPGCSRCRECPRWRSSAGKCVSSRFSSIPHGSGATASGSRRPRRPRHARPGSAEPA